MKSDQEEFLRLTWMLEDAKHNEASALANAEKKGIQIGEREASREEFNLLNLKLPETQ